MMHQHVCNMIDYRKRFCAVDAVHHLIKYCSFHIRTSCASGLRVMAMTSPIFILLRRMYGAAAAQDCQKRQDLAGFGRRQQVTHVMHAMQIVTRTHAVAMRTMHMT